MSINLLHKNGGEQTASDECAIYAKQFYDGILSGCALSVAGGVISIGAGRLIVCGRELSVDSDTTVTPTSGSELIVAVTPTGVELQARAAEALTQDDINNGGALYEVQLGTYTLTGATVTAVERTLGDSSPKQSGGRNIFVQQATPTNPQTGDLWFW